MFKRLKLINFRQHRDREFFFTAGVNAIRGLNEAGKTTLLEGAAYVLFGARVALRESLEDVVTYGEKVGKLKAELDVEVSGTVYLGKRSKSGAEVWIEGGTAPVVVGQDECTNFWASLLGCSPKIATNLMLANQTSIRGALEGGASAPVVLIEQLANFKLIDQIISLVMSEVPNGRTQVVDDRIKELQARLDEPEAEDNIAVLQAAAADAATVVEQAVEAQRVARSACTAQQPNADRAQQALNELQAVTLRHGTAQQAVADAKERLAAVVVPPAPDMSSVPVLRKAIEDAKNFGKAKAAKALVDGLGEPEVEWDEGMDKLLAEIAVKEALVEQAVASQRQFENEAMSAHAAIIKETSCAFCQKDLTDVPEVTTHNATLQRAYEAASANVQLWKDAGAEAREELAALKAVVKDSNARDRIYRQVAEFITLDEAYVPARFTWNGPDVTQPVADRSDELAVLEMAQRRFDQAQGALQQAQQAVEAAEGRHALAAAAVRASRAAAAGAEDEVAEAKRLAEVLAGAEVTLQRAQQAHQTAHGAYEMAAAVRRERQAARARLATDLAKEKENLSNIGKGNALLDKLRSARPQIAEKLWAVVLASVSTYFSTIRGRASVVTRTSDGFLVDGRPIDGLSGSTLDALGLAIRVALVKTFLPNCGFMVLDEPAAACDDGRETNMLGLAASSGFEQVILVTHSSLSDAFAQQVIQL